MKREKQDYTNVLAKFLRELYLDLQKPTLYSLADILQKYRIDVAVGTILLRDHYIIKTGRKNLRNEFLWNVGEPNIAMVRVLMEKLHEYRNKNNIKSSQPESEKIKELKSTDPSNYDLEKLNWVVESILDIRQEINAIQKDLMGLKPRVKVHKYLKFRNPFYFISK